MDGIGYNGQIIVILVGFIFLYPCSYYLRKGSVQKILLLKSIEKIKNDLELELFVTNFQRFIIEHELNEEVEMMFLGFLFMHKEECQS